MNASPPDVGGTNSLVQVEVLSCPSDEVIDLPPPAPEHYRVLKEMIIRSSFFYSLETLFNSASLPVVEMAHTTLDDFILLQGDDASQVDFTPLFPVILSLCRRGFTDHEGFFSRIASKDDKARRHGGSGAVWGQQAGRRRSRGRGGR